MLSNFAKNSLCKRFFDQRDPKLVFKEFIMRKNELVGLIRRQKVINDHLIPRTQAPKPKIICSHVYVFPRSVLGRNYKRQEVLISSQRHDDGHVKAVSHPALENITIRKVTGIVRSTHRLG